jgi:hypothetical protein
VKEREMNAVHPPVSTLLCRAARCTETRPNLVGCALARYQKRHGLQRLDLARLLECSTFQVNALALCHRPLPDDPGFDQAVQALAAYAGCSTHGLGQILRERVAS